MDYWEVRSRLAQLQQIFPEVMTLQNAEDDLGIPYLVNCSKEED